MENHFQYASLNESRILKHGKALLPQFLEGDIFCKKDEEERLVSAIKSITKDGSIDNFLIHGPRGSGKTTIITHLLDDLRNYDRGIFPFMVNCWKYSTSAAIYNQLADALGEPVSRRGRAADEQFGAISESMIYQKLHGLVVLDDVDGLLRRDDMRVLHDIARDGQGLFSLIVISTNKNILSRIHPRIRDELAFTPFEFRPYGKEELLQILQSRANDGLVEDCYDNAVLEKIAELGISNNGNGKLALKLLWKAAKHAESEGKDRITVNDVEYIHNLINFTEPVLSKEERLIIDILKTGEKSSSELYFLFQKCMYKSTRQIYRYLVSLENKGIIETRLVQQGSRPGFKIIKLKEGGV